MSAQPRSAAGRVLLEGSDLTLSTGTGIATYARQLRIAASSAGYATDLLIGSTRGLDRKDPTLAEVMLFDAERKRSWADDVQSHIAGAVISPFATKPFELPRFRTVADQAADRFAGFERLLAIPQLVRREGHFFKRYRRRMPIRLEQLPALVHCSRPAPIHVKGCPNIYTIHDIVPLRLPFATLDNKKYFLNVVRQLCQTADHIVTVSEHSRQDIIRLTGIAESRITNTYQAVRLPERLLARSADTVAQEIEAIFGLEPGGYFLFVGALEPKKNVDRLIDAFAASGVNKPLLIAGGPGWLNDAVVERLKSEQNISYIIRGDRIRAERSVKRLSYLPLDHLVSLIRGARAMLFPSIYEGFGLPVLEAMMLGTPVMTSTVSSLPEIAGDAARLVDPYDIEAMARTIRELDADADLRADLAIKGRARAAAFSPEIYAQRIGDLYRSILGA